jgi:hypothetical protein
MWLTFDAVFHGCRKNLARNFRFAREQLSSEDNFRMPAMRVRPFTNSLGIGEEPA